MKRQLLQVNPDMVEKMEQDGMILVGEDESHRCMEVTNSFSNCLIIGVLPF